MMNLSDLIRKGTIGRHQVTGSLFSEENGVCAIGAAIRGAQDAGLIDKPEEDWDK